MLPPVSPVSAVDVSFQMANSRQDDAASTVAPGLTSQLEPNVANLGAGASLRAVSGEVRLSQNGTVLAETLGKLLNIARMDGEAAEAYVDRLVAAMKSLPADQKAALEKQLGNVLRGITLSMLADVLKNSAGPEAARLAIMFELVRSGPAARDTKPSIPSYLQDVLPESLSVTLPRGNPPSLPNPTTTYSGLANAAPDLGRSTGAVLAAINQAVAGNEPEGDQAIAKPSAGASQLAVSAAGKLVEQAAQTVSPVSTSSVPLLKTGPVLPAVDDGALALPIKPATAAPNPAATQTTAQPPMDTPEAPPVAVNQPALAEIRTALPTITNQFADATPKEMEKLLLAVLLGKLPATAETAPAVPTLPLAAADAEGEIDVRTAPMVTMPKHQEAGKTVEQDAALLNIRGEMAAAHRAAIVSDIKAALIEQPTLHAAVAALMSKEGVALPFVAYPAADEQPESDAPPRGRWPSSEGDAESDDGGNGESGEQSDQDASQEERTAANDENIDHSLSEGANDDGSAGNAESYYLRMSGFS